MKVENELEMWTVAYSTASAILLWLGQIVDPGMLDTQAAAHADAVVARIKAKEKQLVPRK